MKTFLHEVAEDLYARYGEGLSERAILFPSRRARLFFVDALTGIAGRPMWQPRWVTVDDLTTEISGLRTGDRVRLITELYKIYSEYHAEPFDKFYFWGDMLLTDFDTIDKYRIDAAMLFRNISEIKEIEADISYLTPAQLQILRFWSTLADQKRSICSCAGVRYEISASISLISEMLRNSIAASIRYLSTVSQSVRSISPQK